MRVLWLGTTGLLACSHAVRAGTIKTAGWRDIQTAHRTDDGTTKLDWVTHRHNDCQPSPSQDLEGDAEPDCYEP